MNKFIKQQLNKCRTILPHWDDDTTHMIIECKNNSISGESLNTNKEYIIEIKDYIIHEPENFTLSSNWNSGTVPPEKTMRIKYLRVMGKMIQVQGVGITTNIYWTGWLPQKGFEVIE